MIAETFFQTTLTASAALKIAILNQSRSLAPWAEPVTVERYRGRRKGHSHTRLVAVARSGSYMLVDAGGCYGVSATPAMLDAYETRNVREARERLMHLICCARWEPRWWDTLKDYAGKGGETEGELGSSLQQMAAALLWIDSERGYLNGHGEACLERELKSYDRWSIVDDEGCERFITTTATEDGKVLK